MCFGCQETIHSKASKGLTLSGAVMHSISVYSPPQQTRLDLMCAVICRLFGGVQLLPLEH